MSDFLQGCYDDSWLAVALNIPKYLKTALSDQLSLYLDNRVRKGDIAILIQIEFFRHWEDFNIRTLEQALYHLFDD